MLPSAASYEVKSQFPQQIPESGTGKGDGNDRSGRQGGVRSRSGGYVGGCFGKRLADRIYSDQGFIPARQTHRSLFSRVFTTRPRIQAQLSRALHGANQPHMTPIANEGKRSHLLWDLLAI